jgi:hypothetical protein
MDDTLISHETLTASFTYQKTDNELIQEVAVALSVARGRPVSRSAALRHILAVYRHLSKDMRQAAIAADDIS